MLTVFHGLPGARIRAFKPTCPSCGKATGSEITGTNRKLSWEREAGRLFLDGRTVGKKVMTPIQNYPAWQCQPCQLLLFDYSHAT